MKRREFIKYSATALTAAVLSNAVKAEKRFENHDMSVEQKNKGKRINAYNQRAIKAQYLRK